MSDQAQSASANSRSLERVTSAMALPPRLRELLAEFAEGQTRPVTNAALAARMRTEATTWINAVHMQHRRCNNPVVEPDDPGDPVGRQEIDLHFLLVSLTRLRRAVGLATRIDELQDRLLGRLLEFDRRVPYLSDLRNVAEHFDEYTVGSGRNRKVGRAQLQNWAMGTSADGQLTWTWLGRTVDTAQVHAAATDLYRGFHAALKVHLGESQSLAGSRPVLPSTGIVDDAAMSDVLGTATDVADVIGPSSD
jgi:hypothetical protein